MHSHLIVMGVAGCGKSSVGEAIAAARGMRLAEGDSHHDAASLAKMQAGLPLTDADREGWLARLGELLASADAPTVLTCSALRARYRDQLRAASPGLRFVFLQITPELALSRVRQRSGAHFFPASLVESQFQTLESPLNPPEPGVIGISAAHPISAITAQACNWLDSHAEVQA
jgi:gluconokinase